MCRIRTRTLNSKPTVLSQIVKEHVLREERLFALVQAANLAEFEMNWSVGAHWALKWPTVIN